MHEIVGTGMVSMAATGLAMLDDLRSVDEEYARDREMDG